MTHSISCGVQGVNGALGVFKPSACVVTVYDTNLPESAAPSFGTGFVRAGGSYDCHAVSQVAGFENPNTREM